MKISILGSSGFLGKELCKLLKRNYTIKKLNLRNIQIFNQEKLHRVFKIICENDIIINCATSLRPKTKEDYWINCNLSFLLLKYIQKNKINCRLIHISTTDVLIKNLNDRYTISKRFAEKKIKNLDCLILRLPLLYKKYYYENQSSKLIFYNYLSIKFPIYPMFYPGAIYQPLKINTVSVFINSIIKKRKKKGVFNLVGSKKYSTWDIFYKIAKLKNKKPFKLNTKILSIFFPNFLLNNSRIILQLSSVDQTMIKKKIILKS